MFASLESAVPSGEMDENNHRVAALWNAHGGQTIYVVGSGPSLKAFEPEWLAELGQLPSIGLNRSVYMVRTRYFLSSYISEIILAKKASPTTTHLHMRNRLTVPLVDDILTIKRRYTEDPHAIGRSWSRDEPMLCTRRNAVFAATHLALIMGATKVCYVGVEQRNGLHFYNIDPQMNERIFYDLVDVITQHRDILGLDQGYENPHEMMRRHLESPEVLKARTYFPIDHGRLLEQWFAIMHKSFDACVTSANADSVVCDAGATHVPLSHSVEESWGDARAAVGVGWVDLLTLEPDTFRFAGWAVDLESHKPATEVLLMDGDVLWCRALVSCARSDVASLFGNPDTVNSGFDVVEPNRGNGKVPELRAYGKTSSGKLFRLKQTL